MPIYRIPNEKNIDYLENECVIVAQRTTPKAKECEISSRSDDDVPLSSSSSYSRMELYDSTSASLRFPDDRSDSGVSSLRSGSGDERSGSRSSALSSFDEPQHNSQNQLINRSPLLITTNQSFYIPTKGSIEAVHAWREPNLLLESKQHVYDINSVHHQALLMSHPSTTAVSGPPPTSTVSHSAAHYPPVAPPPTLMTPHALQHHHPHLAAPNLYRMPDIWKRYGSSLSVTPSTHLLTQSTHEDMLERDRVHIQEQERIMRERQGQEVMEIEKHKEMDRLDNEKHERDKYELEKQERERELEKERQQQALHNHFEKSLRQAAQQKRDQWNPLPGRPSQPRTSSISEDVRKRVDQDFHQREQQRHLVVRSESKDHRQYYGTSQRPSNMSGKVDNPPPAHSKITASKTEKMSYPVHPKGEVNVYGYPVCHPQSAFFEPKNKADINKSQGLVFTKNCIDEKELLSNPPSLVNELKNSVIVRHDAKTPHNLEHKISIEQSVGPKRIEILNHYLHQVGQNKYDYHSPSQSPSVLSHPHPTSHHHMETQNLGKNVHMMSVQQPSPKGHRQSPLSQSHPSPDIMYRANSDTHAMIYSTPGKPNYSYMSSTSSTTPPSISSSSNTKPKVSSPAPHHIYGKPSPIPIVTRSHESTPPIQLTTKLQQSSSVSPSPYQQVSQYHPPYQQSSPMAYPPPPAHSSRPSSIERYDRIFSQSPVPGKISAHGMSPPSAASGPLTGRTYPQYITGITSSQNLSTAVPSVQTQPLDLGISSNKSEPVMSPKRKCSNLSSPGSSESLELKKGKTETANLANVQPQIICVSEPVPLIANTVTTITTDVNVAAYRTPPPTTTVTVPSPVNLPDVNVTAVDYNVDAVKFSSTDIKQPEALISRNISPIPVSVSPLSTVQSRNESLSRSESPSTPMKASIVNNDSEKSNSPRPMTMSSTYPVRHLKKAWLQRHTGEDMEESTTNIGSGNSVAMPLNTINNVPKNKETPVNSLQAVGSMAVNSINKTKNFSKVNNKKLPTNNVNGHSNESAKGDDSSSSDPERGRKSPPKRKPPKVKRKKGGGFQKKNDEKKRKTSTNSTAASESGSESDKESGSDKDSDSGASTTLPNNKKGVNIVIGKEPRKRGRRPKSSKNDKGEEPHCKKTKDDFLPQGDPFHKPPVAQLKKTGESFLQDGPCFEVAPKLAKCRECRWTPNQRSKNMPNIFCRFYAFRRLRYTKHGQLAIAGFSDPFKDASEDDLKLWLPSADSPPPDLDLETSRFLLKQVGDHFCDLLLQEKDAHSEHMSDDKTIAWKRVVQGVREMCDVCETTLFNFHWACGKCGFVVCLDCYKSRKNGSVKIWGDPGKDRDEYSWLLCTNRQPHEQEKLMLTQIIAGESLLKLGKLVHEVRELWNIEQYCACPTSKEVLTKSNTAHKEIIQNILLKESKDIKTESNDDNECKTNGLVKEEKASPLSWLADVALSSEDKKPDYSSSDSEDGNFSTLRELLIRPSQKPNGSGSRASSPVAQQKNNKKGNGKGDTLDDVISSVIEDSVPKAAESTGETKSELKHFVRRYNWQAKGRAPIPIRIMTLTESKMLYPDIPHSWLCDGKLLRLSDPSHKDNYKIFQDQWKRGQPVIVSDVTRSLNKDLWNPDAFARDFGDDKNDLVNCMTGNLVPNQPMRKFWEGFDHFTKRLKDDRGNPMLLKLKDWPPGEDFAEMLPSRFNDLMKVLPLAEYTHRTGRLNLASRLPDCFVRPDLGPKMYNAYGSALYPSKGTTNLHLDISDAVNVMVYVGIPKDGNSDEHIKEAFRAIDEAGCDILTRRRVRDKGELPGALWHIYNPRDADKIRDLLNKVVVEKGGRLEPHHDPIHDQSCYLDGALRERLYKEYGVEGYAIVQCLGDAVFIPAGAPHQVRNLHNCIKVAEDFVSPENVSHCFHLTQEFRDLSDTHSNHEDKLQIKNIIYHAVKDSISMLTSILNSYPKVKIEEETFQNNGNSGDGNDKVPP